MALPRPSEALGGTLLSIYARERSLPSDMIDLLSQLDDVDASH